MLLTLSAHECACLHEMTKEYTKHELVLQMQEYIQHGNVNTYEHCKNVVRVSYLLNNRLHIHCDEKALVTGALLHDFYLYDWHIDGDGSHRLHGITHPEQARRNAVKYFNVGEKEQEIIRCHMWPLTIRAVPSCREAALVCLADKYCSGVETLFRRGKRGSRPICG